MYAESINPISIDEFIRRVLELYEPPMRAKATYGSMRRALGRLERLEPRPETTADLTTTLIAAYVRACEAEGTHPNTTYGWLSSLRAACNIAAAEGWCRISPFAVRRRGWVRRVSPKPPRVHSLDELAHVLRTAQAEADRKAGWAGWRAGRLLALTAVVAYTGMRKSEALHLRVEDLDFATGMVQLVARAGSAYKTEASAQPLPMPPALVRILRAWVPRLGEFPPGIETDSGHRYHSTLNIRGRRPRTPDYLPRSVPRGVPSSGLATDLGWLIPNVYRTGPWVGGSPGHDPLDQLQDLGRRAGVPGLTFQSLRHSWATHAESAWGLTDGQIQRILRHTNTRTQWHYRHAERNNLRAIAEGISFDGPQAAHGEDFDDEQ